MDPKRGQKQTISQLSFGGSTKWRFLSTTSQSFARCRTTFELNKVSPGSLRTRVFQAMQRSSVERGAMSKRTVAPTCDSITTPDCRFCSTESCTSGMREAAVLADLEIQRYRPTGRVHEQQRRRAPQSPPAGPRGHRITSSRLRKN